MALFKSKKNKLINKAMGGAKQKVKKALSTPIKIAIATTILTIVGWLLVVVLAAGIFFMLITGITNFRGEPDNKLPDIITGDGSCPCGCIWLPNTTEDGNYGFTTGTLSNATIAGQIINAIDYINSKTGYTLEKYMVFGIPSVEVSNSDVPACLYPAGSGTDIYTQLMEDYGSVGANGAFEGGDLKNGKLVMVNAKYLGPYQITPHPDYNYAIKLPDEDIIAMGGTVPTDISNREIPGQTQSNPLYLPDLLYGLNNYYSGKVSKALKYFDSNYSTIGLEGWESATDEQRNMLAYGYAQIEYHGTGIKTAEANTIIFKFMWDFVRTVSEDGISAFDSVARDARGVWPQHTGNSSDSMKEICRIVAAKHGYDYYADWQAYDGDKSDFKVDWIYMPKIVYSGTTALNKIYSANGGGSVQTGASSTPVTSTTATLDWSTTLFIGDSLTVGLGNNTELSKVGAVIESKTGSHIKLDSTDSSGNAVLSAYTRAEKYSDMSAVVIAIGSNDFSSTTFKDDYQALIDLVKTNNPSAKLYFNTLPPVNESTASSNGYTCTTADMNDKGDIIKSLAQLNGATVIDIYPELLDTTTNQLDTKFSADGLHLSAEGYREWWDLIRSTLETSSSNPSSGTSTPVSQPNDANGHWVCSCSIPCAYCSCHDLKTNEPDGSQDGQTQNRIFPEEKPGQASGLWGSTEQLTQWVEGMSNVNTKADMQSLLQFMGKKPTTLVSYTPDKFQGADGIGLVCYHQTNGNYSEGYGSNKYGFTSDFTNAGCGLFAIANAMSTLEKKWVTPAEVAIAMHTYYYRNGNGFGNMASSAGALDWKAIRALIAETGYDSRYIEAEDGYKATFVDGSGKTWAIPDAIDDCINRGGLVLDVFTAPIANPNGNSGHYALITDKFSDGTYRVMNSVPGRQEDGFTMEQLREYTGQNGSGMMFIYPKYSSVSSGDIPLAKNPLNGLDSTEEGWATKGNWVYTSDIFRGESYEYTAHGGTDMGVAGNVVGAPVYAMWDGKVVVAHKYSYNVSERGEYIVIEHTFGELKVWTLYQHLKSGSMLVHVGSEVKAGQHIAGMGRTGLTTTSYGAHLHIETSLSKDTSGGYTGGGRMVVNSANVIGGTPKFHNVTPAEYSQASPAELTKLEMEFLGGSVNNSSYKALRVIEKGIDYDDLINRYALNKNKYTYNKNKNNKVIGWHGLVIGH